MEVALDLPPEGKLRRRTWTPDSLWRELHKKAETTLPALCGAASKVDRDEFRMWMRRLLEAEDEPVLLAPLPGMTVGMLTWPDDL